MKKMADFTVMNQGMGLSGRVPVWADWGGMVALGGRILPWFTLFGTIRRGGSALQSKSIAAESAGRRQLLSRN